MGHRHGLAAKRRQSVVDAADLAAHGRCKRFVDGGNMGAS
jgi:hypothetical protein